MELLVFGLLGLAGAAFILAPRPNPDAPIDWVGHILDNFRPHTQEHLTIKRLMAKGYTRTELNELLRDHSIDELGDYND